MDIMIADSQGREVGEWETEKDLDLDLGGTNDFAFYVDLNEWNQERIWYGTRIYIPETEYGGIVQYIKSSETSGTATIKGDTWRGMLAKKILDPEPGQDYIIVEGELNEILKKLIGATLGSLFLVSGKNTGINIKYRFARHVTLLAGVEDMLRTVQHRLSIKYMQGEPNYAGYVEIGAVPVKNHVEDDEYSQDKKIDFNIEDERGGINHLICLGKGELKDRTRIDLYVQEDGTIGKTQYYKGLEERVAVYDYPSAELTDLEDGGRKRLKELMNYQKSEMEIEDEELEIGDIVAGRDHITGIYIESPVIQKILKVKGGKENIEYRLKGDEECGNSNRVKERTTHNTTERQGTA